MNRKNSWMLCFGLLLCGAVVLALGSEQPAAAQPAMTGAAQPAGGGRVAVIDFVRIFEDCAQIIDLNERIRKRQQDLETEAKQRRDVIDNKQVELTAFQPGTPDFETRRRDLVRLRIEASTWLQVSEQDLDKEKFDWTRFIYEQAMKEAATIAQEKGFEIVLQKKGFDANKIEQTLVNIRRVIQDRAVVYAVPEVDVTDAVIRRLDASYRAKGGKPQATPPALPSNTGP